MVKVERPHGQCRLCGKSCAEVATAPHIRGCRAKLASGGSSDGLLLALGDRYLTSYWLVVETAPTAAYSLACPISSSSPDPCRSEVSGHTGRVRA